MTVPQTVPGRRADTDDTRDEAVEAAVELSAEDLDAQSPAADLVRVYLNGIGKTALLTAAQEVELANPNVVITYRPPRSARTARRCRPSRSSRPAARCRWTRRSAVWSRDATSGSPSPR